MEDEKHVEVWQIFSRRLEQLTTEQALQLLLLKALFAYLIDQRTSDTDSYNATVQQMRNAFLSYLDRKLDLTNPLNVEVRASAEDFFASLVRQTDANNFSFPSFLVLRK